MVAVFRSHKDFGNVNVALDSIQKNAERDVKKSLVSLMFLMTIPVFAQKSKVECISTQVNNWSRGTIRQSVEEVANQLTKLIEIANSDGYTKISAPAPINSGGHLRGVCVTVSK